MYTFYMPTAIKTIGYARGETVLIVGIYSLIVFVLSLSHSSFIELFIAGGGGKHFFLLTFSTARTVNVCSGLADTL